MATYGQSLVVTSLATSSASYTDLSDGPNATVTVTVGVSGVLLVGYSCSISGANGFVSVAVTGASSITENDGWALKGLSGQVGRTYLFTGLTPGTTTVTMKYKSSSGSITFANRDLWAVAL